jgi:hypothetical protein
MHQPGVESNWGATRLAMQSLNITSVFGRKSRRDVSNWNVE